MTGDFSENDSWSATAGKIVGGLNPLADVRDIAAGVKHVAEGKDGAWIDLGMATLGVIPLVGDVGKAVIRGVEARSQKIYGKGGAKSVRSSEDNALGDC